jgi:hypothetical protein
MENPSSGGGREYQQGTFRGKNMKRWKRKTGKFKVKERKGKEKGKIGSEKVNRKFWQNMFCETVRNITVLRNSEKNISRREDRGRGGDRGP